MSIEGLDNPAGQPYGSVLDQVRMTEDAHIFRRILELAVCAGAKDLQAAREEILRVVEVEERNLGIGQCWR